MDPALVQRRTLRLLFATQMVGGMGVAVGISVGALLAAAVAGTAFSGLGQSAAVVGAALIAVPATRIIRSRGRRPGLAFASFAVASVLGAFMTGAAALMRRIGPVRLTAIILSHTSIVRLSRSGNGIDLL